MPSKVGRLACPPQVVIRSASLVDLDLTSVNPPIVEVGMLEVGLTPLGRPAWPRPIARPLLRPLCPVGFT